MDTGKHNAPPESEREPIQVEYMVTGKHKTPPDRVGAPIQVEYMDTGKHKAPPERHLLYMAALQRQDTEFSKQIFPEKEYRGLGPNSTFICL